MSKEPPAKRLRKGTRSCVECRHRKVRCDWPSEGASTCLNCSSRGRRCEAQEHLTPATDVPKSTSRSRIRALENEISAIWKVVHGLQSATGSTPIARPLASHTDQVQNVGQDESDSEGSEITPAGGIPTHLGRFFVDGELHSEEEGSSTMGPKRKARMAYRLTALIALLPPRDDMIKITAHAPSWMEYNDAIFPSLNIMKSGEYMLRLYDQLMHVTEDDDQVVPVAGLLLSIAMTVQHAPEDTVLPAVQSIKDGPAYIRQISEAVDQFVLSDDRLAETLDGIELAMLFTRVQLSRTKLRKTWISLRRIIALAEIISLPRAYMTIRAYEESLGSKTTDSLTSNSVNGPSDLTRRKAEVWEAICTIDRIFSVLWSLPLATSRHPLPKLSMFDEQGQARAKPLLFNLAEVASRVIDLDQAFTIGKPLTEQIQNVMVIDQELRTFFASTPREWWQIKWAKHCPEATIQYYYRYLNIRTHFQLALASHGDARFSYNFITCLTSCQELARNYISLRPIIVPGFFANAVIDLHVFTAVIFLLLSNYRATWGSATAQQIDVALNTELTDGVLEVMSETCSKSDAPFARQGASAVRSLQALFGRQHTSDTDQFTLTIPLVGKVHVSRRSLAETAGRTRTAGPVPFPDMQDHTPNSSATMSSSTAQTTWPPSDTNSGDDLTFSMEYPDNYPLLADEILVDEDWLSWPGLYPDA